jgi:8-oxo-dGTP pyrophosphatase MutT (NUDIX family)
MSVARPSDHVVGWQDSGVIVSRIDASDLLSTTDSVTAIIVSVGTIVVAAAAAWRVWLAPRLRERRQRPPDSASRDSAAAALNAAFAGRAEIKAFPRSDPRLVPASGTATLVVDEAIRARADTLRPSLADEGRNELHAVLVGQPAWHGDPYTWEYETVDFATILALRDAGSSFPPIITANALVCCAAKGLVYLLRRNSTVATYPNCWHIMGGNFMAAGQHRLHDGEDLGRTASRELSEEMGIHLTIPAQIERVGAFEFSANGTRDFAQLTYLGLDLDPSVADRVKSSEEGGVAAMTLTELADALLASDDGWAPTGQLQVLLWLALGAPTVGTKARFDAAEARRIYERWHAERPARRPG